MKLAPTLGTLTLALTTACPAAAEDVVSLKSGEELRGTLVERVPEDHLTMLLGDGRTARIPWVLVDRVMQDEATPAPPATARVHIESEREVTLERGPTWDVVCVSPCDKQLPREGRYRISGAGVRRSRPFPIGTSDPVVLEVRPKSTTGFVGGLVTLSVGGATAIVGLGFMALSSMGEHEDRATGNVGAIVALCGLVVAVPGIILVAMNGRTQVTETERAPTRAIRLPEWRPSSPDAGTARGASMPLWTGRF